MNHINYEQMDDKQLKAYFLAHRQDRAAFEAYMDRINQKNLQVIIAEGEIDHLSFDEQVKIIAEKLSPSINNNHPKPE